MIAKSTGYKASYPLMRLPYHDRNSQTVPNAMHTIKGCIEKIVYLINGKAFYSNSLSYTGKTNDTGKIAKAEASLGRFNLTCVNGGYK